MNLLLTTELDAVNTMLGIIGEAPVNTVEDSGVADAVMARNTLREVSTEVQSHGWHWNTDKRVTLTPTATPDGFLLTPYNALQVTPIDPRFDVVERGGKLWDRANLTFTFTEPLKVDVMRLLEFGDLPQVARSYIALRAGRRFQARVVGSPTLASLTERDEIMALVAMKNHDAETAGLSLGRNSPTVRSITGRRFGGFR